MVDAQLVGRLSVDVSRWRHHVGEGGACLLASDWCLFGPKRAGFMMPSIQAVQVQLDDFMGAPHVGLLL